MKDAKGSLYFAGQGITPSWQMRREMLSPCYTTRLEDTPLARANCIPFLYTARYMSGCCVFYCIFRLTAACFPKLLVACTIVFRYQKVKAGTCRF
ncbi:DUF4113 domain-containing protein [Franconibacter helveticus 513]|uniref:DUF4113 domain-containing protein n=1 Tax=Franconibacter helveticus TaxID=357240 RepID=UPI0008FEF2FB|nr:DUF4113 domain-containing protein [Franconibacter helveticus]